MVYTKARLQDALRVFRDSLNYHENRGLPSEDLDRRLRSKYGFRKSAKLSPLANVNIWQAKFGDNGSDDEEYDPKKERKKLAAARSTKKKRKSDEITASDELADRHTKKAKGDSNSKSTLDGDSAFLLTLRLTSDKGRKLLRSFRDLGLVPKIEDSSVYGQQGGAATGSSSYFDKYLSNNVTKHYLAADLDMLDMDVEVKEEYAASNKDKVLRNGKVVEKVKKKPHKPSDTTKAHLLTPPSSDNELDQDIHVTKPLSSETIRTPNRVHINAAKACVTKPSHVTNMFKTAVAGSSADAPICLDSDTEDEGQGHKAPALQGQSQLNPYKVTKPVRRPIDPIQGKLPLSPISPTSPAPKDPNAAQAQPSILTISTAFAHPLVFLPSITDPDLASSHCHFCTNPRMGIIGLGRRQIEVFVDPENPLVYQEMGDGFRSQGFDSTVMCFDCIETRTRMMRCHLKDSHSSSEDSAFERVRVPSKFGDMDMNVAYQKWLFPSVRDRRRGRNGHESIEETEMPLQPCSLCPMPAGWACCRKQDARDYRVAGDKMNGVTSRAHSSINSMPPPAFGRPSAQTVQDEDAVTADRDSSKHGFTVVGEQGQEHEHKQKAVSRSASSSTSYAQSTIHPTVEAVFGCGLNLCHTCKNMVVDRSKGVLDKKVIMAKFNAAYSQNQMSGRADVEFLFKGSAVDLFHRQEMTRTLARGR